MSHQRVAVVTGANKGIGFAIVKGLCKRFDGIVYLTARNATRGEMAVAELNNLGYYPAFHQLDISDQESVRRFKDHIVATHGGIDILINNAGFQIFRPYKEPLLDVVLKTIRANYRNLRDLNRDLIPILRNGARLINTSSGFGHLTNVPGEKIRALFKNPNLTVDGLTGLMDDYIRSVRRGTHDADGWGDDPYKISKVAIAKLTFITQKELANTNIKVNCINPGYVNTDFNRHQGILTPDEGAQVALYVALDAPESLKGSFVWEDKSVIDWAGAYPEP